MPNEPPAHPEAQAHSQTWPIWPSDCGLALKSHLASMEEPEDPAGPADMAIAAAGQPGGARGATPREALGSPFLRVPQHFLIIAHSHCTIPGAFRPAGAESAAPVMSGSWYSACLFTDDSLLNPPATCL